MTWVKLDDHFPEHPKVIRAGHLAGWLYVCGLAYASRHLTDGYLPGEVIPRLSDLKGAVQLAERLVEFGLWERCVGGYRIHDYLKYNPDGSRVRREREQSAARQEAWRSRRTQPPPSLYNADSNAVTETVSNAPDNDTVTAYARLLHPVPVPVPVPVVTTSHLPVELQESAPSAPAAAVEAEVLDRFNAILAGQNGWSPNRDQLRLIGQAAVANDRNLEAEAYKIADWRKSAKGKRQPCTFRFVHGWMERPPPVANGRPPPRSDESVPAGTGELTPLQRAMKAKAARDAAKFGLEQGPAP